jgi:hypothetical protein
VLLTHHAPLCPEVQLARLLVCVNSDAIEGQLILCAHKPRVLLLSSSQQCVQPADVVRLLCCLPLQTKRARRIAKTLTSEEFEDVMAKVASMARDGLAKKGLTPLFSWDNAAVQRPASLDRMGITEAERVPLPDYSPDMHKVIEHMFGLLKPLVKKQVIMPSKAKVDALEAMALVKECWEYLGHRTRKSIKKDVEGLKLTWLIISTPEGEPTRAVRGKTFTGTGGGWAPKGFR